jgi:isoamylase
MGVQSDAPDFSADSHALAATVYIENQGAFHLMVNAFWEPLEFSVPVTPGGCGPWLRLIDTFQNAPTEFLEQGAAAFRRNTITVQSRSIVLLTTGLCGLEFINENGDLA